MFGHIHENYGVKKIDDTIYANVSLCKYDNEPENKPLLFDFMLNKEESIWVFQIFFLILSEKYLLDFNKAQLD